ncbi:MAG TPA: GIY-YIG nuclease family protein [Massilibacterium sp.]|nr:GIY-YIG nuclease family protein [Massilibacterium sp.]
MNIKENHTLYHIQFHLEQDKWITVGKHGTFLFEKGTYMYIGSAKRNIKARIKRHLSKTKQNRWHIDYVTQYATNMSYETYDGENITECQLATQLKSKWNGEVVVEKFGSSDCQCVSHFFKLSS